MKKKYNSPGIDIEKFTLPNSVMTTSGQGGGDEEGKPPWEMENEF